MVTITSTTYCEADACPGHRTSTTHPGKVAVLTDDMAAPIALVDEDEEEEEEDDLDARARERDIFLAADEEG